MMSSTPDPSAGARSSLRRSMDQHDAATVRRWAWSCGWQVSPTGGLPRYVYELYEADLAAAARRAADVTLEGGPVVPEP